MKVLQIIGADLSKKTIDFATLQKNHLKVSNDSNGFKDLLKWIKTQKYILSEVMIVMEHTGLYSYQFEQFLCRREISFAKVPALAIKRSMGLVRGKNDKIDAIRIARFGFEKRDQLQPFQLSDKTVERLKMLYSHRESLVRHRTSLINEAKAYDSICPHAKDLIRSNQLKLIKEFDQQIKKVEEEIGTVIKAEKKVSGNYHLLQSEKGVGKIVALATIIKTNNFTRFKDARKFCCYSGTAPFENSSGISIRGKTKVSHLADKDMKSKLHQAAKCAIQFDPEIKEYYQKRIAAGKSKMSTLNIVSNKIIFRMFAIIKRQTPFIEHYIKSA
jgi:transposase